jgi:hypothetical protein
VESSVRYDPDSHTILVTLVGAIDEVTMNETAAKARRVAEEPDCFNVLADLRQAVSAVSTVAIFGRAQESQQLYGGPRLRTPSERSSLQGIPKMQSSTKQ